MLVVKTKSLHLFWWMLYFRRTLVKAGTLKGVFIFFRSEVCDKNVSSDENLDVRSARHCPESLWAEIFWNGLNCSETTCSVWWDDGKWVCEFIFNSDVPVHFNAFGVDSCVSLKMLSDFSCFQKNLNARRKWCHFLQKPVWSEKQLCSFCEPANMTWQERDSDYNNILCQM